MSVVENFIKTVRNFSMAGEYRELAEHLNESMETLNKNWALLDGILEALEPSQHSLAYLYVLLAKFNSQALTSSDALPICLLLKGFFEEFQADQIRLVLHVYYDLCHSFAAYIVSQSLVIQAIPLLVTAIDRIRTSEHQLTPIQADLLMLCLKCRCFKPALKYLKGDILEVSTASETKPHNTVMDSNTDSKYFLLYYYYGGMIFTVLKKYEMALYFFEVCITVPAVTMSCIMLEAYKKFVLVSLISRGKILPVPKFAPQVVSRFIKSFCTVYHDLGNAYATSSSKEFLAVLTKSTETLERDENFGLAKQVAISLYKKNIKRLTRTFLTLSLEDVATRVELPSAVEAEQYLFNMIKSGEIFATINQKDGMVVFHDNPQKYDNPLMFEKIKIQTTNVIDQLKHFEKMEEEILLNPAYVKKCLGTQDDEVAAQHAKPYSGDPMD